MVQQAQPDSELATGLWTAQGGPTGLDEVLNGSTPDDSEYIEDTGNNTICEIGLTTISTPSTNTDHWIRFRLQGTGTGGPERCKIELFEGVTIRASTGTRSSRGAWSTESYNLTTGEADSITAYDDLRLHIESSNLGGTEVMQVSWAILETGDAAVAPTISVPDTLALSDLVSIETAFSRTTSDDAGLRDAVTVLCVCVITASDTAGLADIVTVQQNFSRTITDALTLSDNVIIASTFSRTVPDTAGFSDVVQIAATHRRTISDSLGLSDDVIPAPPEVTRTVPDTAGFSTPALDTLTATIEIPFGPESLGLTDNVATATTFRRTVSDTLGLADLVTVTKEGAVNRLVSDTLGLADNVAIASTFSRSVPDTLGLSDNVTIASTFSRSVVDTLALSDNVTITTAFNRTVLDTLALSDDVSIATTFNRTLSDTLGLTDVVTIATTFSRTLADTLALSDDATTLSLGAGEILASEALALSDNVIIAATFSRSVSDALGLADNVEIATVFSRTVADTLALSDDVTAVPLGANERLVSDTLALFADTVQTSATYRRTPPGNTIGLTDNVLSQVVYRRVISDTLAFADDVTILQPAVGTILPQLTAAYLRVNA